MSLPYYEFSSSHWPAIPTSSADSYFQKVAQLLQEWSTGKQLFTLHSSGSTGTPKPIELTREQMQASAIATATALSLPKGTSVLIALNVEMIAGFMMLVRTMVNDWSATVITPKSDPLESLPSDFVCDFAALTPMQLQTLLSKYSPQRISSSFRKILLGGAPIDASLIEQIQGLSNEVYHSYGMTETVSHVALRSVNGPQATEYYRLLKGIEAGKDERGCLYLAGAVTNYTVVQTNDLVNFIDVDCFYWLGRADNIINSGGIKIQLEKIDKAVDHALHSLAMTNRYFSWYLPDPLLGQKLIVVLQKSNQTLPTFAFKEALSKQLSKYEVPKVVLLVNDFKKTASGKIDKRETVNCLDKLGAVLINLT